MASASFVTKILSLQDNMMHFAQKLTSNRDDALDLVQDTTLRALDNEDKYSESSNFKSWIFTIMRNVFINGYRESVRHKTATDSSDDLFMLNLEPSTLETPDESLEVSEIHAAISTLDDDMKTPLTMYIAGYKYTEIAQELSLPVGTVKSRIFFARKRLAGTLSGYKK